MLADLGHAALQQWVRELGHSSSPATVRKIHQVMRMVLGLAVKDGRLARNPCEGLSLPRVGKDEHCYLTHEQVDALCRLVVEPYGERSRMSATHRETARQYRMAVLFIAYTGVRFGEMAALPVGRIDFLRRRAPSPRA